MSPPGGQGQIRQQEERPRCRGHVQHSTRPEAEKQGFFRRLRNRLSKTRQGFVSRVDQLLLGKKEIDEALLEDLEEILITSDLGVQTTMALLEKVREKIERKHLSNPEEITIQVGPTQG